VFLLDPARTDEQVIDPDRPRARYTVALRLLHLRKVTGGFGWRDHLEQVPDWSDVLIVDVGRGDHDPVGTLKAWAAWNSSVPGANDRYDPITNLPGDDRGEVRFTTDDTGQLVATVDLPSVARDILGEGARLVLTVTDRRGAPVDLTVRDVTAGDRQPTRP
jgi:hypothetical protein